MATETLGRISATVTLPGKIPPMPAVARILARHDRASLAAFVAVAIDLMDVSDGDTEAEPGTWPEAIEARPQGPSLPDDSEAAGDELDTSWAEWHQRGRRKGDAQEMRDTNQHEDDEDDDPDTGVEDNPLGIDPEEDCCPAGDDRVCSGSVHGAGVLFGNWGPGDAEDAERERLQDDVPMLSTYSLQYDIFTDKRLFLGKSNLMSSFVGEVRSADTGALHHGKAPDGRAKPGAPV